MSEVSLHQLDELLAVLTEAARTHAVVRAYIREPDGSSRPMRIVEGVVLDVADGRDGRTRVRFAIPTGSGEPVEVRVLVEGIHRAELAPTDGLSNAVAAGTISGPMLRPTMPLQKPPGSLRGMPVAGTSEQTGRHRRPRPDGE